MFVGIDVRAMEEARKRETHYTPLSDDEETATAADYRHDGAHFEMEERSSAGAAP